VGEGGVAEDICLWLELVEAAWQQREEQQPSQQCAEKRDHELNTKEVTVQTKGGVQDADDGSGESLCSAPCVCTVCTAECRRKCDMQAKEWMCGNSRRSLA
jgi:hypothetical protein